MKGMLLATALMIAAAQSNDPFRTPRRNTGVRRDDNQRKPKPVVRELREFTLLGDGQTYCTADLRALPTWQDPGGDGTVYPCGDDCPFMKQFINEDKDEDIETNHSDGRA
jgi:hypothetical protein